MNLWQRSFYVVIKLHTILGPNKVQKCLTKTLRKGKKYNHVARILLNNGHLRKSSRTMREYFRFFIFNLLFYFKT